MLAGTPLAAGMTVTTGSALKTPQVTTDVTSWDTYAAPDDDIHGILLAKLKATPTGSYIGSSQYGFTDTDIAVEFARLGAANKDCRFLFDKTQEAGTHERPVVQQLVKSLQASQWAIGTSKKARQILHTKAIVTMQPNGVAWTLTGSFNLSTSAESQFNIVDAVTSLSRATLFRHLIESMFDWVKTNEGANKP